MPAAVLLAVFFTVLVCHLVIKAWRASPSEPPKPPPPPANEEEQKKKTKKKEKKRKVYQEQKSRTTVLELWGVISEETPTLHVRNPVPDDEEAGITPFLFKD